MRYQNKVAVVTGGSSGIGLATAKQLVLEGARVAISGRDPKQLDVLAKEYGFLSIRADVANLAEIDRFYAEVAKTLGKIDLLFANAGIYKAAPLADTTEALFDELVAINIKGVFFTVQKALPYLNDNTAIVLNSSILNQKAWVGNSIYSATKAAVRSLARSFAADLAGRGIRVNAVSPGPTFTPIFGRLGLPEAELQGIADQILAGIPMKRFGLPEEIANAVLFLGSAESSFITGAEICVDGGMAQI
jgi:NAD(P)-dependent dehydrogenase (short-subunit alcohol dehydrogenase family)